MEHTRVNDYDNGEKGDNITVDVCVDCTEHYNNNNEKVAQGRKFAYLINTNAAPIIYMMRFYFLCETEKKRKMRTK